MHRSEGRELYFRRSEVTGKSYVTRDQKSCITGAAVDRISSERLLFTEEITCNLRPDVRKSREVAEVQRVFPKKGNNSLT